MVRACGWLYLSKRGWVEERKEEPKNSVHETKAKTGSLLPFLFFPVTRQLQLRCNKYTESWSLVPVLPHLLLACLPMVAALAGVSPAVQSYCVATKPSQSSQTLPEQPPGQGILVVRNVGCFQVPLSPVGNNFSLHGPAHAPPMRS